MSISALVYVPGQNPHASLAGTAFASQPKRSNRLYRSGLDSATTGCSPSTCMASWEVAMLVALQQVLTQRQAACSDRHILHIFHQQERDQQDITPGLAPPLDLLTAVRPIPGTTPCLPAPTANEDKAVGKPRGTSQLPQHRGRMKPTFDAFRARRPCQS
ncbi:hypothetical protein N8T08_008728 [Aspergillus melleus]|uniref:Uncharacterized protein n=1 Tax=Aspergillus melleus TaxID=138277 RepID=A0ACC3BEL0_9EURO|nr:hypothetical protein N8T08_008728 [Aspergillus melleus]